jgi:transposase-like protein
MNRSKKLGFKPGFRLGVVQLVLDKDYSIREAADAMDIDKFTVNKRVLQIKKQRGGLSSNASKMTSD